MFLAIFYCLFYQDLNKYFTSSASSNTYSMENIPKYSGKDYIIINNNEPQFKKEDLVNYSFEKYSEKDELGRCGTAIANIGIDLMPDKERESIGMIKPTGWQISKYDFIDGEYLYNRCHLIAYNLTGENANDKNLITCTRHMNAEVMLEFEIKVANYIRKTRNHVIYRVTPVFEGNNMLATGVQMEAYSIEDNGEGIKFNVFLYNVQDRIEIDYSNGHNKLIY
jgi:DNA-entry nuclease